MKAIKTQNAKDTWPLTPSNRLRKSASAGQTIRTIFDKHSGARLYALKTAAFSWAIVYGLSLSAVALDVAHPTDPVLQSLAVEVIGALVIAPIVENLMMVLLIHFLLPFKLGAPVVVLTIALLSGASHWLVEEWRAVAGFVCFGVMSYSYLTWSERPFARRFAITVAQHVLFNTPATLVLVVESSL